MPMQEIIVTLPYPKNLSVNKVWSPHYSKITKVIGVHLNPRSKMYRKQVWAIMTNYPKLGDALVRVEIKMHPPRSNCDIDNILKTVGDALQYSGVIDNDVQIKQLYVEKLEVVKDGRLDVRIVTLD